MKIRQKGFTLIEILIVIVILAVLATLVLPKFLAQPEGALVAEANIQLGSLARAQSKLLSLTGGTAGISTSTPMTTADWTSLGMQMPVSQRKFDYNCTTDSCIATRTGSPNASMNGGKITIEYYDPVNGINYSSCVAPYVAASAATPNTRGCIVSA